MLAGDVFVCVRRITREDVKQNSVSSLKRCRSTPQSSEVVTEKEKEDQIRRIACGFRRGDRVSVGLKSTYATNWDPEP